MRPNFLHRKTVVLVALAVVLFATLGVHARFGRSPPLISWNDPTVFGRDYQAARSPMPDFLGMKGKREGIMGLARCARWLVAFCAALISPAILICSLPVAIGAGLDLVAVVAHVL